MKKILQWLLPLVLVGSLVYASSMTQIPDFNTLTDVSVGSPTDGDIAAFNSATGDWENTADEVTEDYILIIHDETSGTDGGGFTCGGGFVKRTLDNEVVDTGSHSSISSSVIALAAGTYRVAARAAAFDVDEHKLRLQDTTAASTIAVGDSADASADVQTWARLNTRFVISETSNIELQHECTTTQATDGFGQATSLGVEVYAVIEFWREGSGPTIRGFSGALVRLTGNQSIPNNTFTDVNFAAEEYDTDAWHDNVTNNERLTLPTGVTRVQVCGSATFAVDVDGQRLIRILKNDAVFNGMPTMDGPPSTGDDIQSVCSGVVSAVATDYFTMNVLHSAGAALNLLAAPTNSDTWFSIEAIE